MPFIERENGQLVYFDITGHKNKIGILTTHGWIENSGYWARTGVSRRLADEGYCVVDIVLKHNEIKIFHYVIFLLAMLAGLCYNRRR